MEALQDRLLSFLEPVLSRLGDWTAYPFLTNPGDPLYSLYLVGYVLIALGVWLAARRSGEAKDGFLAYLFPANIYRSRSALTDLKVYFVNRLLMRLLGVGAFLAGALWMGEALSQTLAGLFGPAPVIESATVILAISIAYGLCLFMAGDFGFFFVHYLFHKIPVLWEFHKVHHSAPTLNPLTNARFHPVEMVITSVIQAFMLGLVGGVFKFILTDAVSEPAFFSISALNVSLFVFGFNMLENVRHSHIWLDFGPRVSRHFVSPAQHQIHHSVELRHRDRNFGLVMAWWDRLFGTLYIPQGREVFPMGLDNAEHEAYQSLRANYWLPFEKAWRRIFAGKAPQEVEHKAGDPDRI